MIYLLEEASVLQSKIIKLLSSHQQYAHETERWVVALVLMTRLEGRHQHQILVERPQLVDFCCALLVTQENKKKSSNNNSILYARLVAQIVATSCRGVEDADADYRDNHYAVVLHQQTKRLCQVLVQIMSQQADMKLSALDVDVWMALTAWLPYCEDVEVVDSILLQLWQRYASAIALESSAVSSSSQSTATVSPIKTPQHVLEATLTAILDQTSSWNSSDPAENREWLETQLGALLVEQGRRCIAARTMAMATTTSADNNHKRTTMTATPSFLGPMLDWWLQKKKRQAGRTWPMVLLLLLQSCVHSLPLNDDHVLAEKILQLLLACVVNTSTMTTKATQDDDDDDGDALRATAWSTLSNLMEAKGWEWMLQVGKPPNASSPSSSLGRASKLCALLRMASGEWKIQLGYRLHVSSSSKDNNNKSGAKDRCSHENLVNFCGRFLAQSLEYVAQLADSLEDDSEDSNLLPLSNSAILHVRKSLQEALSCSAQYCAQMTEYRDEDLVVVQLLGALLTEFDLFLEISSSGSDHQDEDHSILPAIRVLLTTVKNIEAQASLLPGLLMILASSEGDETRMEVLKQYVCDFVSFFESWWSRADVCTTNMESIECGWHVLELWHDMVLQTGVVVEIGGILRQISRFLSIALGKENGESKTKGISAAVSSFVTLQGDEEPGQPDASTLRCAVEFLQSQGI